MRLIIGVLAAVLLTAIAIAGQPNFLLGQVIYIPPPNSNAPREEFVGPFASWTQLNCAASPTDSTSCWQTAINAISTTHPVLYVPAKTYSINGTLIVDPAHVTGVSPPQFLSIVGADPATTQIVWNGSSGGTMVLVDSVGYSRLFSRITLNGNNLAAIALNQSCSVSAQGDCAFTLAHPGTFDESNEYADTVFENAQYGMQCGTAGHGCADNQMIRAKFLGNSVAGAGLGNFNALVWECFSCTIANNARGLTNDNGAGGWAGGFHAFNSLFQNNTPGGDVIVGNTTAFSMVGNYSAGSNRFIGNTFQTQNVANWLVANNTVASATQSTCIDIGSMGPLTLVNNVLKCGGSTPVVDVLGQGAATDALSVGNTFTVGTVSSTGACGTTVSAATHCHQMGGVGGDTVNAGVSIPATPTMPPPPVNNSRTICDAAAGQAGIAAAMTCAINSGTTKPIVHIPAGSYSISTTLTVPGCPSAGCDMQIIGDGYLTSLNATSANAILQLTGPSSATVSEIAFNGNSNAAQAIVITNADQVGARVYIDGALLPRNTTSLFSDNLNNTLVETHGIYSFNGDSLLGSAFHVVGSGATAAGRTSTWGGTVANDYWSYLVSGDARVTSVSKWTDKGGGTASCGDISLTGNGIFTWGGGVDFINNATGCNSNNIAINNFTGTAGLFSDDLSESDSPGNILVSGTNTNASILTSGVTSNRSPYYSHTGTGETATAFLEPFWYNGAWNSLAESPSSFTCPSATCTLITNATNQLKGMVPTVPTALASGITDVFIHRISVDSATNAVHIQH